MINTAMVFAAGFGKRMRPITDTLPKPLIKVGGTSMLDRALDKLREAGATKAVVNTHYLPEKIEQHLANRAAPQIILSREEPEILETAGGIIKALPHLGSEPFYSVNSDVVWLDGATPALQRLAQVWDTDAMDMLLLLQPLDKAIGYDGTGDFGLTDNGQLTKSPPLPYVFTGVQIIHPRIFKGLKAEPLSLSTFYKQATQSDGTLTRIYGIEHDGAWLHIGTPEGLEQAEKYLEGIKSVKGSECKGTKV